MVIDRLWLELVDKELPRGATTNDHPCPKCKRTGSFSVTKQSNGLLLYFCHRAGCTCRGVFGTPVGGSTTKRNFTPRPYTGALQALDVSQQAALLALHGVQGGAIDAAMWRYGVEDDRLVMPVLSPFRAIRGYIAKRIGVGTGAKTLTYKEEEGVFLGWYQGPGNSAVGDAVVICEDLISALRASEVVSSVAILGTHLNWDMVHEITSHSSTQVICLDGDATKKALGYSREFGLVGNFKVLPLSNRKDIKDMTKEEYKVWNDRLITTVSS